MNTLCITTLLNMTFIEDLVQREQTKPITTMAVILQFLRSKGQGFDHDHCQNLSWFKCSTIRQIQGWQWPWSNFLTNNHGANSLIPGCYGHGQCLPPPKLIPMKYKLYVGGGVATQKNT